MNSKNTPRIIKFLLVGLLTTSFACTQTSNRKESEANEFLTIPFDEILEKSREVALSEIASKVEIIPFENSEKAMLGELEQCYVTENYIFVHHSSGHPVTQFSRGGKFIRNVGVVGKGPEEFNNCQCLSIDPLGKRIYICGAEIVVYDFDGNFCKKTPKTIDSIFEVCASENTMISIVLPWTGDEPSLLIAHNEQGDTLQTVENKTHWEGETGMINWFLWLAKNSNYHFNETTHVKGFFCDTIYACDEVDKIVPKYFIDLHKHKPDYASILSKTTEQTLPKQKYDVGACETDDFILLPYGVPQNLMHEPSKKETGCVVYNKRTKKGVGSTPKIDGGLVNDITGGPNFVPRTAINNKAVMIISACDLKEYLESDRFKKQKVKLPKEKEKLQKLGRTLNEDDNSFFVVVHLK